MNCPLCDQDARVLRADKAERRRECTACGHRFTTTEILKDEHERMRRIVEDARALAGQLMGAA